MTWDSMSLRVVFFLCMGESMDGGIPSSVLYLSGILLLGLLGGEGSGARGGGGFMGLRTQSPP